MILAPLASASQGEGGAGGGSGPRSLHSQQASGVATLGEVGGVDKEVPLITVKAKTDGGYGGVDTEVDLASFACNFMVDPISEFLVVLNEVNIALQKMLVDDSRSGDTGHRAAQGGRQDCPRSSPAFAAIDEEREAGSEVREKGASYKYVHGWSTCGVERHHWSCVRLKATAVSW